MIHISQSTYEKSISAKGRVKLYDAAIEKFGGEAEAVAREQIREQLRDEVKKEVVAEYARGLKEDIEQRWTDDKKAAMKKEVQAEYEAMLAKIR